MPYVKWLLSRDVPRRFLKEKKHRNGRKELQDKIQIGAERKKVIGSQGEKKQQFQEKPRRTEAMGRKRLGRSSRRARSAGGTAPAGSGPGSAAEPEQVTPPKTR